MQVTATDFQRTLRGVGAAIGTAALFAAAITHAAAAPAKPAAKAPPKAGPSTAGLLKLSVVPEKITLSGRDSSSQFLVFGHYAGGRREDLTAIAQVARVGMGIQVKGNRVTAINNGQNQVVATVGALKGVMNVITQDTNQTPEWSFANEIVPIFTKTGCNSGGCHGSPSGRGGFRLSLFGYEPDYDFDMITKDRNGSRVNKQTPSLSSVLTKPSNKVPHGGGARFKEGSEFYTRILDWLRAGAPKQPEFDPRLKSISIYPTDWTLDTKGDEQQILVLATRDDGTTQDVTRYARFTTQDDQVVEVDEDGRMTAVGMGETSIMIRYLGGVGIVRLNVPRPAVPETAYAGFKPANYIDEAVLAKLKEVRITPSELASDAEFLRRAYIDTCGITPTVEEARAFLDDTSPDKRTRLVNQLLNRPEFIDYWTLKWSDLLRNNGQVKQDKGQQVFYRWIKESIRQNKPYDQFVRELVTASGSPFRLGPVNWYRLPDDELNGADYPLFLASQTSQVFLGVRIDCARCHNHPFEAWSQMDYYQFAAFFGRTRNKPGPDQNERVIYAAAEGEVFHPRKPRGSAGSLIQPKFLGGDVATFGGDEDRREKLARWITSPSNYWFKRSIANRLWNNFLGRGIVSPVDDYRLTNPAANVRLLDVMAEKVVEYKWDLKQVMRDILTSRTYQTTSTPNKLNVADKMYASHALPRRIYAEVLLDTVCYVTGVNDKFGPYEYGRRAISIPDNRVNGGGFLDLFGRAPRSVACECERPEDTNVAMVLNLLNGQTVNNKISAGNGRVALALQAKKPVPQMIEEFYLAALSRRPTEKEATAATKLVTAAPSVKEGAEDLMWSLLNMREFLFNH